MKYGLRVQTPQGHHDFITNVTKENPYAATTYGKLWLRIGLVPLGVRITVTNLGEPPWMVGAKNGPNYGEPVTLTGVALGSSVEGDALLHAKEKHAATTGFSFEGMTVWEVLSDRTPKTPNTRRPLTAGHTLEGGQSLSWVFDAGGGFGDILADDDGTPIQRLIKLAEGQASDLVPEVMKEFDRNLLSSSDRLGFRGLGWYLRNYDERYTGGRWPGVEGPFAWGCVPWAEGLTSHYGIDWEALMSWTRSIPHKTDEDLETAFLTAHAIAEAKVCHGLVLSGKPSHTSSAGMENYEKSGGAQAGFWPNRSSYQSPLWTHNWPRGIFAWNAALLGRDYLFSHAAEQVERSMAAASAARVWNGNYGMRGLLWWLESFRALIDLNPEKLDKCKAQLNVMWGYWKGLLLTGFRKDGFYPTLDAPSTFNPWMDLLVRPEIDWLRGVVGDTDQEFTVLLDRAYRQTIARGTRKNPQTGILQVAMVAGRTDHMLDRYGEALLTIDCLPGLRGAERESVLPLLQYPMQTWDTIAAGAPIPAHRRDLGADTYAGTIPKAFMAWARAAEGIRNGR